jgi:hypothetical protein
MKLFHIFPNFFDIPIPQVARLKFYKYSAFFTVFFTARSIITVVVVLPHIFGCSILPDGVTIHTLGEAAPRCRAGHSGDGEKSPQKNRKPCKNYA